MRVAMIVMAVAEMGVTLSVLLLRSEGIAARVSRPMRILVHLELFYALGPASAALCALITQFDTSPQGRKGKEKTVSITKLSFWGVRGSTAKVEPNTWA